MTVKFANNATSKLATSIAASDTTIVVLSGDGAKFPATTSGDTFPVTLVKSSGQVEICRCTARAADTFTITRGQEGTAAASFNAGDRIELRMTDGAFEERLGEKFDKTGGAISGNTSVGGDLSATGNTSVGGDLSVTGNTSVGGSDSVLPVYSSPPLTDVGPIYIIGQGDAEWDGSAYSPTEVYRPTLVKEFDDVAIIKTGHSSAAVRAGSHINVAGAYVNFDVDTAIAAPGGGYLAGEDYSVWVKPDGTAVAVADPFSAPAAAPAPGAVKIGGFHYGLVAPGTTVASGGFSTSGVTSSGGSMAWTQTDVDKIAGINEFSIWDLTFRCAGEQRGMAFDPISQCWVAIYLMSTDSDANGPSRYNTDVASGTVLPKIPAAWGGNGTLAYAALRSWEANEMVTAYGLRLIRYEEFVSAAFGVTEGQSLGGSSVTIPATARQPNYTSRIGLEQATGNAWIIGGPINSSNGTALVGNGRGSWFGTTGLVLLGGHRAAAADSGSRAAHFAAALSDSYWSFSVRAAGDHVNLGRTAR